MGVGKLDKPVAGVNRLSGEGTGKITGSLNGLTDVDKTVVINLTARGEMSKSYQKTQMRKR